MSEPCNLGDRSIQVKHQCGLEEDDDPLFLLTMTDDVSLGLVDEANSTNYPEGDARLA